MKVTGLDQISSLKISELLVFVELAQVKSVREIARRKKVDPATISRILSRVERAMGQTLFVRTADGVVPNDRGLDLIEKCRQLVNLLEAIGPGDEPKEVLSFGSTSFLSTRYLAPRIEELVKVSGGQVRIFDFPPDELISAGLKGAFNVALHFGGLPWPQGTWTSVSLGDVSWGLYCRSRHPLARKSRVGLEEILKCPFVYPIYFGSTEVTVGNDQLPIPIFRRKKMVGTSTAETAFVTMRQTDLLAYLPSVIADESVAAGDVRLLQAPWDDVRKTLFLTVKSDTLTAPKFRELTKILKI